MFWRIFQFFRLPGIRCEATVLASLFCIAGLSDMQAATCYWSSGYSSSGSSRYWFDTDEFRLRAAPHLQGCERYERDLWQYPIPKKEILEKPILVLTGSLLKGTGTLTITQGGKVFEHKVHALRGKNPFDIGTTYGEPYLGHLVYYRMTFRTTGSGDPDDMFRQGMRARLRLEDWGHSGASWGEPPPYRLATLYDQAVFAQVPLPATAGLALAGLGGLAFLGRSRRRV
jgi:hypothetical protein